jgi:flavin-dependent dehydrogenase
VTGVPISREIEDATGTINIATSEYAKFATSPLPEPSVKGDIVLLVGWYRDNARYAGSWQMTLNSLSDLGTGFDAYLESINYKR